MDNIFHILINHNLLLIYRILNHNLLSITNVNSFVRIEEHNKPVPKIILTEKKMVKHGNIHSGVLTPDKKIPIIPLGNNYYAIKKNPTDSSLVSLRTETRKMH